MAGLIIETNGELLLQGALVFSGYQLVGTPILRFNAPSAGTTITGFNITTTTGAVSAYWGDGSFSATAPGGGTLPTHTY